MEQHTHEDSAMNKTAANVEVDRLFSHNLQKIWLDRDIVGRLQNTAQAQGFDVKACIEELITNLCDEYDRYEREWEAERHA